jgi:hypothetical protein
MYITCSYKATAHLYTRDCGGTSVQWFCKHVIYSVKLSEMLVQNVWSSGRPSCRGPRAHDSTNGSTIPDVFFDRLFNKKFHLSSSLTCLQRKRHFLILNRRRIPIPHFTVTALPWRSRRYIDIKRFQPYCILNLFLLCIFSFPEPSCALIDVKRLLLAVLNYPYAFRVSSPVYKQQHVWPSLCISVHNILIMREH